MITKYPYPTNYCFNSKTVILEDQGLVIPAKSLNYGWEPTDVNLSEAALQQRIFMHHWNTYPDERGLLYHNNNNSHSRKKGAIMKGQGVVAGVADLTYLYEGKAYFLELKLPGQKQKPKQTEWQAIVEDEGFQYFIIRSIADFEAVRGLIAA